MKQYNRLSVPAKLVIITVIIVFGCVLGLTGAVEINKAATLHKLNFLHVKYNHTFMDHVTLSGDNPINLQQLKSDLVLIRAQPLACIDAMGLPERILMEAIGTSRTLELCIEDIGLANTTLSAIDAYQEGAITNQDLARTLQMATEGFQRNSAEFEPLVDQTAGFVFKFVFILLVTGSMGVFIFTLILMRSVAADYKKIKQTEEELRRYELIVSSASDMLALVDRHYVYLAVNAAYSRAFAKTSDEVIGHTIADVIGEDYFRSTIKPLADRCLAGENIRNQVWFDFPQARHRFIDAAYSPFLGMDGKVEGFSVTARDITSLELTKATLSESEERFRTVLDTIGTGAIVTDAKGLVQIFNPAAEAIFGYKSDEIMGKNVAMLMPNADSTRHNSYIQNYVNTKEAKIIGKGRQVVGTRKDGEEFPLQLEIGEVQIGNEACFVASIADLTKIHALEDQLQQSQKLEAVGQLTGGIAHDFNNLLAVIQGNLSLLEDDLKIDATDLANGHLDLVRPAIEASIRGAELTQRLLAFSRKQTLQPRTLDVSAMVGGMEDMLRRTLGETIVLKNITRTGDWLAMVDPSQLESALLNLVLNARDAMAGAGTLIIETADVVLDENFVNPHQGPVAGDYVMLSVSDTGIGMDQQVLQKVFEPFFTTKGVGEGSGLGLSMVHGFVKQSGGLIEISSKPENGTTVNLYLPRSRDVEQPIKKTGGTPIANGHETILVVEDELEVRRMTVKMLQQLGYRVLEATDGKEALQKIENTDSIDLLFTDVILPGGITGPDIARRANEMRVDMKVLFMSGYSEDAIAYHGEIDACSSLLQKPFSLNDLAERLREVLTNSARRWPSTNS